MSVIETFKNYAINNAKDNLASSLKRQGKILK